MKQVIRIATIVLTLGAAACASAQPQRRPAHHATISLTTARATAVHLVPGRVRAEELEREHGRWIYSFEIVPAGVRDHTIREVNIDADTGALVGPIEIERQ